MKWNYHLASLIGLLISQQSIAFYNWEKEDAQGDARLLLRGFVIASKQADNGIEQGDRSDESAGGLARLIMQSNYGSHLSYEFNTYQTYIDNALIGQESGINTGGDVERSGALEWSFSETAYAHLAIDRMNVRWSGEHFNLILGRQAINLATTFFFSPNDFFAPFTAQTFYRVYKPGVDAVRAKYSTGELSYLSFIGVLGYTQESDTDSGWSEDPESTRNSWLLRYVSNLAGFEWGLVTGKVRRNKIDGLSLSGEVFGLLGLRAEAHQSESIDEPHIRNSSYSIGLEHRWESSFMIQFEQFYHSIGALDVASYDLQRTYPARRYQALGLSYEFSPLWTGQASLIYNQIDYSRLYSLNLLLSVSDESDLSIEMSVPDGKSPLATSYRSEFGAYPMVLNIEFRRYF